MKEVSSKKYGCAICGKGVQFANMVSHAKNSVHTIRRPNLHTHRLKIGDESLKLRLCSKCKRQMNKKEEVVEAVKG